MADLGDLRKTLEAALVDEPPLTLHDGGLIRESWNPALGELRREAREARAWIAGLEERERARTGIGSLRVRFNRVFGYGIEIPKSQARSVPAEYVRRQTLAGAERYVTAELKEYEAKVLGAESRMSRLEYELFDEVRRGVAGEAERLLRTARAWRPSTCSRGSPRWRTSAATSGRPSTTVASSTSRRAATRCWRRRPDGAGSSQRPPARSGEVECLVITGPNMAASRSTCARPR